MLTEDDTRIRARAIDRLTITAEFITSTIRAIAHGRSVDDWQTLEVALWARSALGEFFELAGLDNRGDQLPGGSVTLPQPAKCHNDLFA